ncbi:hypothetical protein [Nocardia vinacea]|uniref:hypothetical protein n=1 Tax=Nocardia vinacea TaxID=96468 RepID=UPI00031681D2|nr:hypothetical protein [Nocardia vinacea]
MCPNIIWHTDTDTGSGRADPFALDTGFAPQALTIGTRHLEIGSDWAATLAVTGYPREVTAGWFAPLLSHPGRVEVAVHIDPVDPVTAATRLRHRLARLESSRMHDASRGRPSDSIPGGAQSDQDPSPGGDDGYLGGRPPYGYRLPISRCMT